MHIAHCTPIVPIVHCTLHIAHWLHTSDFHPLYLIKEAVTRAQHKKSKCHDVVMLLSQHNTRRVNVMMLSWCCHDVVMMLSWCCHEGIWMSWCCHDVVMMSWCCQHNNMWHSTGGWVDCTKERRTRQLPSNRRLAPFLHSAALVGSKYYCASSHWFATI